MTKKRILVADDDESVRKSLKRYFEFAGHHVDVAHSYLSVKDLLDANRYDLIVSDNGMPIAEEARPHRTCGLELLAYAKLSEEHHATPFVINTGDDLEETKKTIEELGGIYRYKLDRKPMDEFFRTLIA